MNFVTIIQTALGVVAITITLLLIAVVSNRMGRDAIRKTIKQQLKKWRKG